MLSVMIYLLLCSMSWCWVSLCWVSFVMLNVVAPMPRLPVFYDNKWSVFKGSVFSGLFYCLNRRHDIDNQDIFIPSKVIQLFFQVQIYSHTETQTHRYTGAQVHRCTGAQTHRHTDTQTHRHADTQTHRHTPYQAYTNTQNFYALFWYLSLYYIRFAPSICYQASKEIGKVFKQSISSISSIGNQTI
jgi:hypothetical protein